MACERQRLRAARDRSPMQLESTLTCPSCGHWSVETMPTDACQFLCRGPWYAGIGHGCRSPAHDGNLICKIPPRRGSDTDSRALIIMRWSRGADRIGSSNSPVSWDTWRQRRRPHVAFGSKPDLGPHLGRVRSSPTTDIETGLGGMPVSTTSTSGGALPGVMACECRRLKSVWYVWATMQPFSPPRIGIPS
jgi:hypothetical protein